MSSNDIGEDGNSSLTCPLDEAQIAKDEHAIEDSWEKYNSFWDMLELHKCGTIGGSHGSNAGELMVFRVLEYVKGSMSLHLSEGLSDAYEVLEVMVHNLKLLNKALNHPSEKDMDAKNMTEELKHIYAKLQDTKLKLQPLMKTFFSVSKINNSADQAAVAAVQEVKAVVTNNQKGKGKQSKKSKEEETSFSGFIDFYCHT